MMKKKLLLVDDDAELLESLSRLLIANNSDIEIRTASNGEQAQQLFVQWCPQVAIIDLSLNEKEGVESGYALLQQFQTLRKICRVIVLTGHGSVEHGVRAIAEGASHFLEKPADVHHIQVLLRDSFQQYEYLQRIQESEQGRIDSLRQQIAGASEGIEEVRHQIHFAAANNLPVLIVGETGTGKGLCAQRIHAMSARNKKHFVRYQPASLNGDLVQSELFGHRKGSFTGADTERKGLIAQAEGGTLFLDEIDELPLETQVFLLGVLQEKKYRPLGEDREQTTDFRLICATNANIDEALKGGKLRKDFYHRIAGLTVALPPLRARKADIAVIVEQVLRRIQAEQQVYVTNIEEEALAKLQGYDWPGNVRELIAVAERGAFHAAYHGRDMVRAEDVMIDSSSQRSSADISFQEKVQTFKRQLVQEALDSQNGNQVQAAQKLGIDRSTLRRILGL